MQMGEKRDWQSVKLPRHAGQPEQRFPARRADNTSASRVGSVVMRVGSVVMRVGSVDMRVRSVVMRVGSVVMALLHESG